MKFVRRYPMRRAISYTFQVSEDSRLDVPEHNYRNIMEENFTFLKINELDLHWNKIELFEMESMASFRDDKDADNLSIYVAPILFRD